MQLTYIHETPGKNLDLIISSEINQRILIKSGTDDLTKSCLASFILRVQISLTWNSNLYNI
jgi:hypothetical protein